MKTFLREYKNVYSILKSIKSDKGSAFIKKQNLGSCSEHTKSAKIRNYGTFNLNTDTGLVGRTIQSMKMLIKANSEDEQNLRESQYKALCLAIYYSIRNKERLFEVHLGHGTKLSNAKKYCCS